MRYDVAMTANIVNQEGAGWLKRRMTARLVEVRLQEALHDMVPDWTPTVTRTGAGRISVKMRVPARSEYEAKSRLTYWVKRVVGPAGLTFNKDEITSLEAKPVG